MQIFVSSLCVVCETLRVTDDTARQMIWAVLKAQNDLTM